MSHEEALQINQRTKTFQLSRTINHAGEARVEAIEIEKPPGYLTATEFALLNIHYGEEINNYIKKIDTNYVISLNTVIKNNYNAKWYMENLKLNKE